MHAFEVVQEEDSRRGGADVPLHASSAAILHCHCFVLFGDEHRSTKHMCTNCGHDPRCKTIVQIIESFQRACETQNTYLNVFVEFPYVIGSGRLRREFLRYIDKYMRRKPSFRKSVRDFVVIGLGLKNSKRLGVLNDIYETFADRFYHHDKRAHRNTKFHFADARWEPNMWIYVKPPSHTPRAEFFEWITNFRTRIPDIPTFRAFVAAFLYDVDFPSVIKNIFGEHSPVMHGSLSSLHDDAPRTVHKIAKQYLKLRHQLIADGSEPSSRVHEAIDKYIRDRVDTLMRHLQQDIGYEDNATFFERPELLESFMTLARLDLPVLLMDVYLLCRVLRYSMSSYGGCTLIYAGDVHVKNYARFFQDYLRVPPVFSRPPSEARPGEHRRCVELHRPNAS